MKKSLVSFKGKPQELLLFLREQMDKEKAIKRDME